MDGGKGEEYAYLFWGGLLKPTKTDADDELSRVVGDGGRAECVRGRDLSGHLMRRLCAMGLSVRERTDFVTYWCPQLEHSAYVDVAFLSSAEYDRLAALRIEPRPDVLRRVFAVFRCRDSCSAGAAKASAEADAAQTAPLTRRGLVCVEWGGIIL